MTDRLTIDQCRVGMLVKFADARHKTVHKIAEVFPEKGYITLEGSPPPPFPVVLYCVEHLIPAAPDPAPLPAMTAELLDVYEYYRAREIASDIPRNWWAVPIRNLLDAIERAGIVQPRPTDDEIAAARQVIERAGGRVEL